MRACPSSPGPNGSRVSKKRAFPQLGDGLCEILDSIINPPTFPDCPSGDYIDLHADSPSSPSSIETVATERPPSTSSPITDPCYYTDDGREAHNSDAAKSSDGQQDTSPSMSKQLTKKDRRLQPSLGFGLSSAGDDCSPSSTEDRHTAHNTVTSITRVSSIYMDPADTRAVSKLPSSIDAGNVSSIRIDVIKADDVTPTPYKPVSLVAALQDAQRTIATNSSPLKHMRYKFLSKLSKYDGLGNRSNVHVFVDMSNIHISFCDAYKTSQGIPTDRRVIVPSFHFKVFASILERGRPVEKKILAGSTSSGCDEDHRTYWPQHFFEAENIGYQMNIFSRVQKRKPLLAKLKRKGKQSPRSPYPFDTTVTSGDETSEGGVVAGYEVRNGEQGVDENIHLNMMDSLFECRLNPGTVVLATGDAARAEFSSGFLTYASRLLDAGWNVELVAWKKTLSSSWTNPEFTEKYRGRFNIIFLDEFLEELQVNFLD